MCGGGAKGKQKTRSGKVIILSFPFGVVSQGTKMSLVAAIMERFMRTQSEVSFQLSLPPLLPTPYLPQGALQWLVTQEREWLRFVLTFFACFRRHSLAPPRIIFCRLTRLGATTLCSTSRPLPSRECSAKDTPHHRANPVRRHEKRGG